VLPSSGKKQGGNMAGHRGSQWTAEEDRRLLDLIRMNKSWVLISAALSRNVKSIRDRARHLERQAKIKSADPDAGRSAPIGA
jgi:Myb-like DNA-binding domain